MAEKLRKGELKADKIIMKSWLLSKERDAEIRQSFGKDVTIKNVPPDDEEYAVIQFLALQYNQKSLKKYLETESDQDVRLQLLILILKDAKKEKKMKPSQC